MPLSDHATHGGSDRSRGQRRRPKIALTWIKSLHRRFPYRLQWRLVLPLVQRQKEALARKYAYAWITIAFFLVSIVGHWLFGWYAYVDEASSHGQSAEMGPYLIEMGRDTFENWQSEFLQLLWQVVGLAYFLYVGSPSSKENDDRLEAKIDALLRINGGDDADRLIRDLDREYMRTGGHAQPHSHDAEMARSAGRDVRHVAASTG